MGEQQPDRGAGLGNGRSARSEITKLVLGLAGGLAVNDLSSGHGWRVLTVVVVMVAVLLVADVLPRLPPGGPWVAAWSCAALGAAGLSAAAAVGGPARWQGYAAAAATVLAVGALTIRSDPGDAFNALAGGALVGAGVGVGCLGEGEALLGMTLIGAGVAGIGFGVGVDFLVEPEALVGLTLFGLGVVGVGFGMVGVVFAVGALAQGEALSSVAVMSGGVAVVGGGVALTVKGRARSSMAGVGLGVALIGAGAACLIEGQAFPGVALIGLGVTAGGLGSPGSQGDDLTTWLQRLAHGPGDGTNLSNENTP